MKKVVLSVAIMSFALLANAQVLKKDLLKDYKPGDQLEKAVYGDKKEPIRTDSWNGAFSTNPLEGVGSPLVGKALSYKGYPEGGLSIVFCKSSIPQNDLSMQINPMQMSLGSRYETKICQ